MDTLLVVGADSVVGANLALGLSKNFQVVTIAGRDSSATAVRIAFAESSPTYTICCGEASRSSWDSTAHESFVADDVVVECARLANQTQSNVIVLSSDAVFTGPWMSHDEDSQEFCHSARAECIRKLEQMVMQTSPDALMVRCNAFGVALDQREPCFAETFVNHLQAGRSIALDPFRHASPILVSDLADLLTRCIAEGIRGILHLGSIGRTNPLQFAEELAVHLDLPRPVTAASASLSGPRRGFGGGETALNCSLASSLLDRRMPLISDCVARFVDQLQSDYAQQLNQFVNASTSLARAA